MSSRTVTIESVDSKESKLPRLQLVLPKFDRNRVAILIGFSNLVLPVLPVAINSPIYSRGDNEI
jgi:hypothetical protein